MIPLKSIKKEENESEVTETETDTELSSIYLEDTRNELSD